MPRPLTSLVGREGDVAAVRALLVDEGVRLLTLTGPGGVGKTRLALRVGEEVATAFADGVVFVPLSPILDPELVFSTIAQVLGLSVRTDLAPAELVLGLLRNRQMLLILDNFEQVVPAAVQVADLLAECPSVAALVTSRVLLHVHGEQRYPVAPLAVPRGFARGSHSGTPDVATVAAASAVQLFVGRAGTVDPQFSLDAGNAEAVAAICRRLDGLPLAIELAAARLRLLTPRELLDQLDPALPLLTGGPIDAPERLRTMRRAISWSYDLLAPSQQALFRRLSVFVGGFTLAGAERVLADGVSPGSREAILDGLTLLLDGSLLRRVDTGGETRFELLETVREFAVEQLRASGEMAVIAGRHAAWCVDLATALRRTGRISHRDGLTQLEREHPNLRAALAWLLEHGEYAAALHLSGQLAEFWMRHGHFSEGQGWLERCLAADTGTAAAARVDALVGLSMLQWPARDWPDASRLLAAAESLARAADDAGALAYARLHQGYVALFAGDLERAVELGEVAMATCDAIPQGFSCHGALWLQARASLELGADERAMALYERLMVSALAGGDDISIANAHLGLAILDHQRGELRTSLASFADALAFVREFGELWFICSCLDGIGVVLAGLGRPADAARLFGAEATLRQSVAIGPLNTMERVRYERAVTAARAVLGDARFDGAWEDGAALSLDEAIAEVMTLAREVANPLAVAERTVGTYGLTPREIEVLRSLVRGHSDKEIAVELFISRHTVSKHVTAILAKLGVESRTAAVAVAMRDGEVQTTVAPARPALPRHHLDGAGDESG